MDNLIPERESLTVEFKSDRDRLPDTDLVAAVVCLANTDGGELFVGVEPDGSVTGLHATHQNVAGLAAMIANRTVPPLSVRVEAIDVKSGRVAKVSVPKSRQLIATSDGLLQRRRLKADGQPECVPFYPHEFGQRHSDLGLLDYSALPVANSTMDDLDPVERARLRQVVQRYGGDTSLLPGGEADLGMLRLVIEHERRSNSALPVDSLIALSRLRNERRVDTKQLAEAIQKDEAKARSALERLVEAILVEAHGVKKGRTFTLAASVYRDMDDKEGYVRQVGFELIQQEQMALKYAKEHGRITRREAASLCQISEDQASRLLRRLAAEEKLVKEGERRGSFYHLP